MLAVAAFDGVEKFDGVGLAARVGYRVLLFSVFLLLAKCRDVFLQTPK
jgi:hypothetical protein